MEDIDQEFARLMHDRQSSAESIDSLKHRLAVVKGLNIDLQHQALVAQNDLKYAHQSIEKLRIELDEAKRLIRRQARQLKEQGKQLNETNRLLDAARSALRYWRNHK